MLDSVELRPDMTSPATPPHPTHPSEDKSPWIGMFLFANFVCRLTRLVFLFFTSILFSIQSIRENKLFEIQLSSYPIYTGTRKRVFSTYTCPTTDLFWYFCFYCLDLLCFFPIVKNNICACVWGGGGGVSFSLHRFRLS